MISVFDEMADLKAHDAVWIITFGLLVFTYFLLVNYFERYLTTVQLYRKRKLAMINLQKLLDEMNDRR